MTDITAIITIRRDTSSNWTAANTILADGEFAKETNTGKIKLGNGVTAWNSLAYFTGDVKSVNGQTGIVLVNEVPNGGTTGQVLAKNSNTNNDTEWVDVTAKQIFFSLLGNYKIDTSGTTPPATHGDIKYSNATQISSTNLYVSDLTSDGIDIEVVLSFLTVGSVLLIQDADNHLNYQNWQISAAPTLSGDTYTIPVTLASSAGTGTTGFANNHDVFFSVYGSPQTFELISNKDIDGTLAANSDTKYPSQKATKTYVDTGLATKQNSLGFTPENVTNKDIDGTLAANSDTRYASQKATKTYTDAAKALAISTANGYTDTGLAGKQNTLGFTAEDSANKDIDGTLAANSDIKYASQKATKTYVDTGLAAKQNSLGFTAENVANKDIDGTLATNSDTKYPSQKAVKTYVDTGLATKQNSLGFTPEDVANKKSTIANSATDYPSSAAVFLALADNLKPRVSASATATTLTINADSFDCISVTALASALTLTWSGTPVDFQGMIIRLKDNGTARALTFTGSKFEAKGTALPTTTVAGKVLTVAFLYDSVTGKFGCVGAQQEA
jgi:disulfide oxidoreductase YuzD